MASQRGNDFLRQFIEMRQSVAAAAAQNPSAAAAAAAQMPASKKAKKTSKTQVYTDAGVENIIEHKPGKKDVIEWLQGECDKLTAAKMA